MRLELVVVRPRLELRAEREDTAGHVDLVGPGRGTVRVRRRRNGIGAPGPKLQRLEHRLLRGELVLHDEPECEPAPDECVGALEVDVLEEVDGPFAHIGRVGAHGFGAQSRQARAVRARAPQRVVDVPMCIAGRRRAAEVVEDPELLEVRDVGKAPHERRRER